MQKQEDKRYIVIASPFVPHDEAIQKIFSTQITQACTERRECIEQIHTDFFILPIF